MRSIAAITFVLLAVSSLPACAQSMYGHDRGWHNARSYGGGSVPEDYMTPAGGDGVARRDANPYGNYNAAPPTADQMARANAARREAVARRQAQLRQAQLEYQRQQREQRLRQRQQASQGQYGNAASYDGAQYQYQNQNYGSYQNQNQGQGTGRRYQSSAPASY